MKYDYRNLVKIAVEQQYGKTTNVIKQPTQGQVNADKIKAAQQKPQAPAQAIQPKNTNTVQPEQKDINTASNWIEPAEYVYDPSLSDEENLKAFNESNYGKNVKTDPSVMQQSNRQNTANPAALNSAARDVVSQEFDQAVPGVQDTRMSYIQNEAKFQRYKEQVEAVNTANLTPAQLRLHRLRLQKIYEQEANKAKTLGNIAAAGEYIAAKTLSGVTLGIGGNADSQKALSNMLANFEGNTSRNAANALWAAGGAFETAASIPSYVALSTITGGLGTKAALGVGYGGGGAMHGLANFIEDNSRFGEHSGIVQGLRMAGDGMEAVGGARLFQHGYKLLAGRGAQALAGGQPARLGVPALPSGQAAGGFSGAVNKAMSTASRVAGAGELAVAYGAHEPIAHAVVDRVLGKNPASAQAVKAYTEQAGAMLPQQNTSDRYYGTDTTAGYIDIEFQRRVDAKELDPNDPAAVRSFYYDHYMAGADSGRLSPAALKGPGFQSLDPVQQAEVIKNYSKQLFLQDKFTDFNVVDTTRDVYNAAKARTNPAYAANELYQKNPEYKATMDHFFETASPEALGYVLQGAGSASGDPDNEFVANATDKLISRFSTDGDFAGRLLLSMSSEEKGAFKPDRALFNRVRQGIEQHGFDKWAANMDPETILQLGAKFGTPGGNEFIKSLGPGAEEFTNKMTSAIQSRALSSLLENPFNAHRFAGLWFRMKGYTGVADFAENPLIFYGGLAALLLGGVSIVSGLFDDDDDDDEDAETDVSAYKKRLNSYGNVAMPIFNVGN